MPEESFEEKTEAPTPKRRREAREKGNVAKSTEVNSVLVLLTGIFMLKITSVWIFQEIGSTFRNSYALISDARINPALFVSLFRSNAIAFCRAVLPVAVAIMIVGLFANIIQIGFLFTLKPLEPKFEKINPFSGFKRMLSLRSLVEACKNIFKMIIVGVVAYLTIKSELSNVINLNNTSVGNIWIFILQTGFKIGLRTALVLLIIAVLDYVYQRYEHEKKLKMTRQEIKEERKEMEGDPQVKSRIRSLQREMARRRMMEEVPKATVVVTNPTQLAIAIRYEAEEMAAPVVLAKGKLHIAEKIKEIALKENIPIVEDKPLAQAMYNQVEPGDEIPIRFFNAVAEILAYVYKLKNRNAA